MLVDYSILQPQRIADFLIVTATNRETNALLNIIEPISDKGILETSHNGLNYIIGKLGLYNIIHCQCNNMGAIAKGASLTTVDEAIKTWPYIKGVIMVGIAFGMYPDSQKYGDVLVCEKLHPYESQRVSSNQTEYRADPLIVNKHLLAAFRDASTKWSGHNHHNEKVNVEFCSLVTGEKLVDRVEYRNELAKAFPDARGGEMEGQGLSTACERYGKPWILVKSICDFADGNKNEGKHEKQDCAAALAFDLCKNALECEDFIKTLLEKDARCVYSYNGDTYKRKFVLFQGYNLNNEPFYIEREFDKSLHRITRTHGCWIYGNSGVGKSVALSRLLLLNRIPFISIDLSTCIETNIDEMFIAIYENICEKVDEIPLQMINSYRQCTKEIGKLLEKYYANKSIVLFIDEIPLDANNKDFCEFINKFVAFIIYLRQFQNKVEIRFVLSSLESPESFLHRFQEKLAEHLKIIHMPEWSNEECISLIDMITDKLGLKWDENYKYTEFINIVGNTPRIIKDILNQAIAIENTFISRDVINKLLR